MTRGESSDSATRAPLGDKALAVAALGAFAAHPLLGPRAAWPLHAAAGALSISIALASLRAGPAVGPLAALLAALSVVVPFVPWPPSVLVALVIALALGRVAPRLRPPSTWRARGRIPLGWTLLVGGVTPFALASWMLLLRPDLHDVRAAIPTASVPLAVLIAGGAGFALVNAAFEELVWRGVLQDRLEAVFGARAAIGLQAVSFGVQHLWGIPRGAVGVLLAGVWAVMVGVLRRESGGLLAPFVAHVMADATIAVIILGFVE